MWRIGWAPNNASRWQMGFNSAFKGLMPKWLNLWRAIVNTVVTIRVPWNQGIPWLPEELFASQEGLWSVKLVDWLFRQWRDLFDGRIFCVAWRWNLSCLFTMLPLHLWLRTRNQLSRFPSHVVVESFARIWHIQLLVKIRQQLLTLSIIVQQDTTMYSLLYFCKLLYMFRVVTPPIIRSTYKCNYSIWHWSNRLCYLPLSWRRWNGLYFCKMLYMFREVNPPIIKSIYNCN